MLTAMLVEDNVSFREAVRSGILSQFPSMEVMEASNGEEALKGLASNSMDLIFMDISLPGPSGIALTQEIKADNQAPAVVMLSGHDTEVYRNAAVQSGAAGFIGKDSVGLAAQISTVVGCFHRAKEGGRLKPGCLLV